MKKIYSLLLLGGLLLFGVQSAWAADPTFLGNSAVNFNETWYYCEVETGYDMSWCSGGAFNSANLGNISSLKLGGQIQAYDGGNNWASGHVDMHYKIDSNDPVTIELEKYDYKNNNMFFESRENSTFVTTTVDISGLSEGKHTIAIWYNCGSKYDSNGGSNYVATFYVSRGLTLSDVGDLDYGYATFCGPENFTVSGATAYKAALSGSYLTLTAINSSSEIIPKEVGIILYGDDGGEVTISYTSSAATATMTGNVLLGTIAAKTTSSLISTGQHFYAFNKTTNTFAEYSGTNFPANKAYFVSTQAFQAPTAIRFIDEEQNATDIMAIDGQEKAVKFIKNGQLLIQKDGVVYDMTGRAVK